PFSLILAGTKDAIVVQTQYVHAKIRPFFEVYPTQVRWRLRKHPVILRGASSLRNPFPAVAVLCCTIHAPYTRSPIKKILLFALTLLPALPTGVAAQTQIVPIQNFFKDYFEEQLKDEPENATSVGRHDYDDRWSDVSKAGRDVHLGHLRARLAELNKYDFSKL